MTVVGERAFVFGGANSDGPRKDLIELDLKTLKWKNIMLDDKDCPLPMIEMHTAHVYKENQLLVVGGRALEIGKELDQVMFSDVIYSINLDTGKVSEFCSLPSALASHVSCIIEDKYLIVYGGTNGLRFFDSILRLDLDAKTWTLMTK